jgi:hypothetical protein
MFPLCVVIRHIRILCQLKKPSKPLARESPGPGLVVYFCFHMEKVLKVFSSFEEAERADDEYYASLAPQQRVDLLLDLIATYRESLGEAGQKFERVYRVVELSKS